MNEYGREIIERDRRRETWLHGEIKRGAAVVKIVRWFMNADWNDIGNWTLMVALLTLLAFCPLLLGN